MRYLLDTNIFVYSTLDPDRLSSDVYALLEDYDNILYLSMESVRELVVAYRNKGLGSKKWRSAKEMVRSIERDYNVTILPLKKEHLLTMSDLELAPWHKDPSDHLIISQAITERIPLISSDLSFPFYIPQGLDLILNHK